MAPAEPEEAGRVFTGQAMELGPYLQKIDIMKGFEEERQISDLKRSQLCRV